MKYKKTLHPPRIIIHCYFRKAGILSSSWGSAELVYQLPELKDIQAYCKAQQETLWDEVKRFENPHKYYVDLSWNLWTLKRDLLAAAKK